MVKIFIAGAHGYIGYPIAHALVRAGHYVYGLTRDIDVAKVLQENEIIPIIGDASRPREWIYKIKDIDIVIDVVGGSENNRTCTVLYQAFQQEARSTRPHGPPLTYIYTSTAWVHGDSQNGVLNDNSPPTTDVQLTSWRIPHERQVLTTKTNFIQGIVIRPGIVYGRNMSVIGEQLFKRARSGFVQWYGRPGGRIITVHQDDLAELFVKVIEKAAILGGLSFVAANPESESMNFILSELCKIVDAKDVAYMPPSSSLEKCLVLNQRFNARMARDLLGWIPKKPSLGQGFPEYYATWQASQGKVDIL